ncbi:LamG domain-containing protein [Streptomyces griseorubiginosus]|uniref:LamG domain-containing protein n=1 Tax=Streptomyces griseorubiginosus TaxID=67304 RepID=UPI0033B59B7A
MTALLAGLPVVSGDVPDAEADGTSEAQAAAAQAAESGERVEVVGQRTEYSTTYANPDGLTFKLVQSAVPVRARLGDGSWVAPDATLERRADGSIGPKAAVLDIALSDGGDGADLMTLADHGKSLSLGWPGTLPKPVLDGASALYVDVLPGVDLRMTATVEGIRQVLVVNDAAAAANPELKKLDYSLQAEGLTVRDEGGNLSAVDGNGNAVFRAPAAQMWDSAGDAAPASSSASAGSASQASFSLSSANDIPASDDEGSGEESADPADGPGDGDVSVMLPVSADTDSVTVVPDAGLLTGEDTVYPLYIDPDVSWGESERTLLSSDGDTFYNFSGGDDGKGVGYCGTYVTGGYAYYCGSGYKNRMYFEFSPSQLAGKQVLDVTFRITERFSMSCEPSWVDLARTGNISSSTKWPGPTANWDLMVDRYVSAGRGSACDPSQPDKAIEFNDNPEETNENLTSTVKKFAAGDISRLTLMLKAHDESDPNGWKRFDDDATLDVDFVGIPAKPTAIGLVTGDGVRCETDQSDPLIVSTPNARLTATVQTAKGGEEDALLRAAFDLDKYTASSNSWSQAVDEMERPTSGHAADNAQLFADTPTLTDGTLYRYRTWTRSYYNSYNSHLSSPSNAATGDWCYFKVDSARPKAPGIAVAKPYSRCATVCDPGGGPGVKASFTFTPAAGDTNTAYIYMLSTENSWSAPIPGSTVTKDIIPTTPGTYTIYVRAKDTIGWGAQNAIDFLVAEGPGPVGQWHFDEASGTAVDSSTTVTANQDNATLSASGASRDGRGRRGVITKDATGNDLATPMTDTGLTLDGSAGYAATSGAVLETRASYTVSAWARIAAAPAHNYAVVSQVSNDATASGFALYYSTSYKGWIFNWHWRDSAGTSHIVRSYANQTSVPFGVWTHLAGVYDSGAKTIQLYVNGKPQGSPVALDSGQPTAANGSFLIGRTLYTAGSPTDYFGGQIDEVRAWQVRLTDALISTDAQLVNSNGYAGAELVASWNPADASATASTLADNASGYGRSLTLSGGAKLDGEGIVLQGPASAATASGPLVDETGSFTATTAVQLDGDALVSKNIGYTAQVIGQRSADGSAWGFWYEFKGTEPDPETDTEVPVGFWHFGRLNADGSFTGVTSDAAAMLGSPVRMTGVYDAQSGTVSLYLGLNQNGADTAYTAVVGSGDFAVGKGFANSAWGHYLPGSVTDIRVWAGAMASQDQIRNTVGD